MIRRAPKWVLAFGQKLSSQTWLEKLSTVVVCVDKALMRVSRGRFGLVRIVGMDELVLHTIGRRSGLPRETPLLCISDGDRILIAGTNWGKPSHPAWVHNLRAGGPARITHRGRTAQGRVRELIGAERDEAYALLVRKWSTYRRHQARTDRVIPVFEIRR